jgi:hypothetical protein
VLDGYDSAAAAAGIGREVGEVGEPRRGAGGDTRAAELPGQETAEEGRGGAPPCRHEREKARTERGQEMAGRLRGARGGMGFNGGRSRGGAGGKKFFVVAPREKMKPPRSSSDREGKRIFFLCLF